MLHCSRHAYIIVSSITTHNHFTALFPGSPGPGWAGARRELLDFMVQGKINRGRHIDHPAGRHSIWSNQYLPSPPSPHIFTGRMPFLPPNQQRQSTEGNTLVHNKCCSIFYKNVHNDLLSSKILQMSDTRRPVWHPQLASGLVQTSS